MELNNNEAVVIAKTVDDAKQIQICELHDLQLALVGGGVGEVVWG